MVYSCELLEHHVKMSTEGFGTVYCFPETNCYKFSLWICLYPHPNRQSVLLFFFFFLQLLRGKRILTSVLTVITPSWKGSTIILLRIFFSHSSRGLNKGCNAILMYRLLPSFQFSSSSGRINIVPSWSCGFGLFPPFSLLATVSAAPFPLQTSHVPQLSLPVAQARHNVCYQQDIVSFYDSSLTF